jgi:hypothetical protein
MHATGFAGRGNIDTQPSEADVMEDLALCDDDIIIMGSDGLWDNMLASNQVGVSTLTSVNHHLPCSHARFCQSSLAVFARSLLSILLAVPSLPHTHSSFPLFLTFPHLTFTLTLPGEHVQCRHHQYGRVCVDARQRRRRRAAAVDRNVGKGPGR